MHDEFSCFHEGLQVWVQDSLHKVPAHITVQPAGKLQCHLKLRLSFSSCVCLSTPMWSPPLERAGMLQLLMALCRAEGTQAQHAIPMHLK